jgi:hypothetical protein
MDIFRNPATFSASRRLTCRGVKPNHCDQQNTNTNNEDIKAPHSVRRPHLRGHPRYRMRLLRQIQMLRQTRLRHEVLRGQRLDLRHLPDLFQEVIGAFICQNGQTSVWPFCFTQPATAF